MEFTFGKNNKKNTILTHENMEFEEQIVPTFEFGKHEKKDNDSQMQLSDEKRRSSSRVKKIVQPFSFKEEKPTKNKRNITVSSSMANETSIEISKKKSEKQNKKMKLESSNSSEKKKKNHTFFDSPYLGSSATIFTFPIQSNSNSLKKDEKEYQVKLHWNPPHHVEWACNCSVQFGLGLRNDCKHIRGVLHSLNHPVKPNEEKVKIHEELDEITFSMGNLFKE